MSRRQVFQFSELLEDSPPNVFACEPLATGATLKHTMGMLRGRWAANREASSTALNDDRLMANYTGRAGAVKWLPIVTSRSRDLNFPR